MNRRTFLTRAAGAAAWLGASPVRAADTTTRGNDDDLLAAARENIEQHRKGPGVVRVRGADGKPVPGAMVKVEQVRHEFLFGCNLFRFDRVRDPAEEEMYRTRFAALLNFATLGFYWAAYEPQRGQPHYAYTDKVLDWCRAQGITPKGHPLAWDHVASSPRWLPEDPAELERLSTARVREIVARFKGRIDIWDVVNEPTDLTRFKTRMNTWARQMGAVPFTRLHLQEARAAHPAATLLVNDYRTDPAFYKVLEALREHGRMPFDAVGIQSHMHDGGWPLRRIGEVCDRFARLGLPVHFTETTIVSGPRLGPGERWGETTPEGEARQAEYVPRFYTLLYAQPAVRALTWWDFSDQGAWQGAAAGWLRKDMSPKPVYDRLQALIKGQWWTRAEGKTDGEGQFATRATYGTQRLTAQLPGGRTLRQDVQWTRSQPNRFELHAT